MIDWSVFVGFTLVFGGGAAWMMGQALAANWKPAWMAVVYSVLLGLADRFLVFALFDGELLSLKGFVMDTLSLMLIGLAAWRATRARKMTSQYPWLYERSGFFTWRLREGQTDHLADSA